MNIKFFLYLVTIPFVMYALDCLNINHLFKKNKILQARILYIIIGLVLTYLLVNFMYDFYDVSKII